MSKYKGPRVVKCHRRMVSHEAIKYEPGEAGCRALYSFLNIPDHDAHSGSCDIDVGIIIDEEHNAYFGDWIVREDGQYRVYSDEGFANLFEVDVTQ